MNKHYTHKWQPIMRMMMLLVLLGVTMGGLKAQVSTGYTFASSSGTYTSISAGTKISTTATNDDDNFTNISLPFTFVYNGNSYTAVSINNNGFMAFGTTVSSSYTSLSTGATNNVASVMNRDLQGAYIVNGTTTNGSSSISGTFGYIRPGTTITGTGIPTNATVVSANASTVTISANATASGTVSLTFGGDIRVETRGSAPNRQFVVQWENYRRYSTTGSGDNLNFQIILNECTRSVSFVYGPSNYLVSTATTATFQVGLRGSANTDFNNRTATTTWATTSAGTGNTATMTLGTLASGNNPANGLTFTWTPNSRATMGTLASSQTSATVGSGTSDNSLIRLDVPTTGVSGVLSLSSLTAHFTATNLSDISNVKLWTGSTTAPVTQIGSTATLNGDSAVFSGLTGYCTTGSTSYFWITVSVSAAATNGNTIDGQVKTGRATFAAHCGANNPTGTYPAADLNPSGALTTAAPSTYNATVLHQHNAPATVNKGTSNVLFLAVKVVRSTSGAPISLSRIVLNTTGSTAIATDAANVRMFSTGSSSTYAATTPYGTAFTTPTSTMAFNGNIVLNADTNYFWVVANVPTNSMGGDTLDFGVDSVYVNGTGYGLSPSTAIGYTVITPIPLNYSISRSTGITYTSIQSTGTNFSGWTSTTSGDDNLTSATTMPFNFSYAGLNVTSFRACTNGWMTLNGASVTSNTWTNNLNGNSGSLNTVLAPFWDDLVVPGQLFSNINSIKYKVDTVSTSPLLRVLTVEWSGMERFSVPSPSLNFQVKLYEGSNMIEFVYGNMTAFDGSAAVGWTYSVGMNTWLTTTGLGAGDVLAQQQPQTTVFSNIGTGTSGSGADGLTWAPNCYSKITFTPGTYTPGANLARITNDECSNAIGMSIGSTSPSEFCSVYRTGGASASASIPTCTATTTGTPDDDVWFTFTNNTTRDVTLSCRGSNGFDPVVQVFSGTCGSLTSITCNNANSTVGGTEEFTLVNLTSGTYYVRVYHGGVGYSSVAADSGVFTLDIYSVPPPANDSIGGAIALSATSTTCTPTATQSTLNATPSPEFTCGGTPTKDVWYYFIAQATGHTVTVTPVTPGTTFNPQVQVFNLGGSFTISNATSANSIACQNNSAINAAEVVSLSGLTPGNYYAVRVYHTLGGAGGTGNFNICVVVPPNAVQTISATQQTGQAAPGTNNVPVMLVQIPVSGGAGTLTLNSIRVTAANTNNADMDSVKLWQTSGTTFTSPTLLGAGVLSSNQVTFSSLGLTLNGTTNLFVTYNITSGASINNTLDLNIASGDISISNAGGATAPGTQPASALNPSGNVLIDIPLDFSVVRSTGITYNSIMSRGNSYGFTSSNGDDQLSPGITLPFTFQYKGITVSSVKACTNGWLTLNGGSVTSTAWANTLTGNSTTQNGILAPHWDDLVCTGNSTYTSGSDLDQSMKWKIDTISTSPLRRVFIAEWAGMEQFLVPGPNLNFQVRIYEATNIIEYVYGNMSQFDGTSISEFSYSVGMNSFGTSTQGAGQFLALQETNTDIIDAIAKDNHSWSPECYSRLTFTPGTHGSGTPLPLVSNDSAGAPIVLTVGTNTPTEFCTVFRTRGATPSPYAAPVGNADDDVWFSFTTTTNKRVVIDLRSAPSFDGVWQLFNSSMSALVTCNKTGVSLTEDSTVFLTAGTYYIRAYHFGTGFANSSTAFGNFALFVYDAPIPPANDWVTTATTLNPGPNATCAMSSTQSTLTATASGQTVCTGTASKDVWYKFTAEIPVCTLTVTPVTPGATFNPVVAVYDAGTTYDTATMTNIVCQNNGSTNQSEVVIMTSLVPGKQYAVRVYHNLGGAGGTGNFTICLRNAPGHWLGNVSNEWFRAANWSDNVAPTTTGTQIVSSGRSNYPVISTTCLAGNLTINNGGSITVNSGGNLVINGTLVYNTGASLVNNSGTITLNSSNNIPAITYNALRLTGATATYTLAGNATINNVLTLSGSAATLNLGTFTLTEKTDMVLNGTVSGSGKILISRTSGYGSIYGNCTLNNIEVNAGSGGGLRFTDTVQINGTLTFTAGSLSLKTGSRLFVGTNTTSTGNIVTSAGTTLSTQGGTHLGIFGNASSAAISNLSLACAGSFTMDYPRGISLGAGSFVSGTMSMVNGTLNQNGFNLSLGKSTSTAFNLNTTNGRFKNSGSTGMLTIDGAVGSNAVNGILVDTVASISVFNPSGITLGSNVYVKSLWTNYKGSVNLNGKTVTLSPSANISEQAGQVFNGATGSITTTRTIASAITNMTNIAGLGLRITTSAAPGVTTIIRKHNVSTNNGNSSIKRNFTITVASPVTLGAVEMTYDSTEMNGVNRSRLKLNKFASSVWTKVGTGSSTNNAAPTGWVSGSNQAISGTTVFTASDSSNSLSPVFVNNHVQPSVQNIGINSVFPNPFAEQFSIDLNVAENSNAMVRITDLNGKVVYNQAFALTSGQNILNVQSSQFASGVYLVSVFSNEEVKTFRVVKQ